MDLSDFIQKLHEEDPDFGKVNNADPCNQFAFEIQGDLTVAQVMAFSDAEAKERIVALDDYGNRVESIPLSLTSRGVMFLSADRCLNLPFKDDVVPSSLFISVMAVLLGETIWKIPEQFGLHYTQAQVLALPFYRFYFGGPDRFWEATMDTFGEP